jgi:ABC-type multidrug transport system fused ATPase/permease subunit
MKRQRVEDEKKTGGLRTLWFFLSHYKRRLALLICLAILIGYLETLSIAVLYPILDASLDMEGGLSGNLFFRALNYLAGLIPVDSALVAYCILFILLVFVVFLCRLIYINLSARTIAKVATDFKIKVFQKFTESDYQFFVDNRQGDLLYMAKGAPDSTGPALEALALSIVEIIMAISVLALLISISWKATIGVVVLGAAYYYFTRYLGFKVSYIAGKEMKSASQDENAVLNEYISGAKQIITARTGPRWRQSFKDAVVIRWQFWAKNMIWKKIPPYILETLLYASVAIVVIAVWALYPDKFHSLIPMFGTFAFAVFRLLPRLANTGTQLMQMMSLLPNLEVTRELLEDKTYNNIRNGTREFPTFQSSIEFKNIGFTHKNKDYVTLSDISLRVEKNRTTAIVGPSGAGKSTLVDLFLRLYDVDSGVILIDGMDIKDYELSSFLGKVGFVGQETFIYNASVRDNIAFGADYDLDKIKEAAKLAHAHGFIEKLDRGYDTIVGDRGVRLSGGERQRIAIARAMIRKPQILVLDEATSSLDNISERIVQEAIDKVSENCTTLVVAHRLSTIMNAGMIYVIDSGRIAESGTHSQLLTVKGKYWELYNKEEK